MCLGPNLLVFCTFPEFIPTISLWMGICHRNLYWFRGITSAYGQRCSRASSNLWASSTDLFGSKTRQPLETYSRFEQTKPFGDHQDFPPTRGVGYLNRFQGHLLPYTYTRTIQEMPEISYPRSGIPVQGPAIRFVHSTLRVHRDPKGGETDGHTQGFKNPPVPRRLGTERLVRARSHQARLQHTQELVNNVLATGLAGELREFRAGAQTRLRFYRLPIQPQV